MPRALKRIATHADGWTPAGVPIAAMATMMQDSRKMAVAAGRNLDAMKLIVRANVSITPQPLEQRFPYVGSWEQVLSDIEETRRIGADELFVDPQGQTPDGVIGVMERLKS